MARYIDAEILSKQIEQTYLDGDTSERHLCINDEDTLIGKFQVLDIIFDQPAADVEKVKRGEWITSEPLPRTYGRPRSMCSRCGAFARYEMVNVGVYHEDLSKRCPECGAKMDGRKTE